MRDLIEKIPPEFYRGDAEKPRAETVSDLIEQLRRLPGDLPVLSGVDNYGCELTVFNVRGAKPFLGIEEIEGL